MENWIDGDTARHGGPARHRTVCTVTLTPVSEGCLTQDQQDLLHVGRKRSSGHGKALAWRSGQVVAALAVPQVLVLVPVQLHKQVSAVEYAPQLSSDHSRARACDLVEGRTT